MIDWETGCGPCMSGVEEEADLLNGWKEQWSEGSIKVLANFSGSSKITTRTQSAFTVKFFFFFRMYRSNFWCN